MPFGDYKVFDPKYNKYNFRIHDYFLAKALDQVRPGGMVAVITTKGTLDKANPTIRKYLAERAELVGAVRLPNTAFKDNAGTEALLAAVSAVIYTTLPGTLVNRYEIYQVLGFGMFIGGHGNMRDYPLADHKYAIEQLAQRHHFIDIDKVGIHGYPKLPCGC